MDKPLRMLVVGLTLPLETFLDRLLRGLSERGMEITLATAQRPEIDWLKKTGVHWIYAPIWRHTNIMAILHLIRHTIYGFLLASADSRRMLLEFSSERDSRSRFSLWYMLAPFAGKRWDVVYFPWNGGAIAYFPLFALGMPVVLSCRGSQINIAPHGPRGSEIRSGLQATFNKAAAVHCVSQDIFQKAQQMGLKSVKASIIYPAVDIKFFAPVDKAKIQSDVFRVITTGSLSWVKGLEYALQAIHDLKERGIEVEFEIIGDGYEYDRVLYTIQNLGLSSSVHLAGRLLPQQVRTRLQTADVFLLASLSEGVSNAVLEAMSCGLPIVTSDCGGMREAVTNGVEGFIVPVRDPDSMAIALKQLWQEPDLRNKMGQAGRKRVIEQFSLQDQVERFYQLFRGVVQ